MTDVSVGILATWLRLLLVLSFSEALVIHLVRPERLRGTLRELELPAVSTLVLAGDALVLALLLVASQAGGAFAALYLLGATILMGVRSRAGKQIKDCGCSARAKPVDRGFFVRNAALFLSAFVVGLVPAVDLWSLDLLVAAGLVAIHVGVQRRLAAILAGEGPELAPQAHSSIATY